VEDSWLQDCVDRRQLLPTGESEAKLRDRLADAEAAEAAASRGADGGLAKYGRWLGNERRAAAAANLYELLLQVGFTACAWLVLARPYGALRSLNGSSREVSPPLDRAQNGPRRRAAP
jgi:hypothetical protein